MISVVIPTFNEEACLARTLGSASPGAGEIVVVDAGSTDRTCAIAERFGALLLQSIPSKGAQLAAGAATARGDILLFLHADTELPEGWAEEVERVIAAGAAGGAFRLTLRGSDSEPALVRLERWVARRNRFTGIPYGDQALFASRSAYDACGGIRPIPIMEDFDFVRRLKRAGPVKLLDTPVLNSPRRYQRLGIARSVAINQLMVAGYFLGVAPEKLARWYRR